MVKGKSGTKNFGTLTGGNVVPSYITEPYSYKTLYDFFDIVNYTSYEPERNFSDFSWWQKARAGTRSCKQQR